MMHELIVHQESVVKSSAKHANNYRITSVMLSLFRPFLYYFDFMNISLLELLQVQGFKDNV